MARPNGIANQQRPPTRNPTTPCLGLAATLLCQYDWSTNIVPKLPETEKNCINYELLWGFCSVLFVIEIELKRTYVWFNLCILLKELQFLTSYQLYWSLQTSDLALTEWLESCFYNCHLVLCCKTLMYKLCQPCLKYKQRDFLFFLSLNDFSTCLIKQLPIIHHKYTHVILKGKSLKIELANKELPPRLVSKCIT